MAISKENKRVFVTMKKRDYEYLEQIVNIYNDELEKEKNRLLHKKYKLSVSALYSLAMGNLILQIDNQFDLKKSKEWNHKRIYHFLCPGNSS